MLHKFRPCHKHNDIGKTAFHILKRSLSNRQTPHLKVREDIALAIENKQPVVALESTILTHGLPYPENLKCAQSVEGIIKEHGALPATVGLLDGELIVGMGEGEIQTLVERKDTIKTSRRDMSYVLGQKLSGGTTVSGTMVAARLAGLDVFVTGGIGGVHRGASETFDISADLMELSRTPVAVVCSGVKSILDIGLTLEYLETQGVPVITFGGTKDFPAFFTRKSKFKSPYNSTSISDISKIVYTQFAMGINTGLVIGVPIPESTENGNDDKIEDAIQSALDEAKVKGISGKETTPFLLERIVQLTGGDSLQSNLRLIKNNAKVGAQISVELSKLKQQSGRGKSFSKLSSRSQTDQEIPTKKRPVVIGGSIFDIKATAGVVSNISEDTNIGQVHTSFGGVGRNIAECLGRLETNPYLISAVGRDHQGEMLLTNLSNLGIETSGIKVCDGGGATASYSIMANAEGELKMAVGDMETHEEITPTFIESFTDVIKDAGIVVVDGNLSERAISAAMQICSAYDVPTWFEPTTVSRAERPFKMADANSQPISYVSPNYLELTAIHSAIMNNNENYLDFSDDKSVGELSALLNHCKSLCKDCSGRVDNILVTLGKLGTLIFSKRPQHEIFSSKYKNRTEQNDFTALHYPPACDHLLPVDVRSVSGAGDSFASGVIYGILQGYDTDTCIKAGLYLAFKSLHTYVAISEEVTSNTLSLENIHLWAAFEGKLIF